MLLLPGIGCPSAAIAVEELANIGAKTLVRLGTSGAMQEHTRIGDLVIANGAVRQEGTSPQYMPMEFPAVPSSDMVFALEEAAKADGTNYASELYNPKILFTVNMILTLCQSPMN